jgi:hypothetical protein
MSQTCQNQKFATAISSSQFVQAPQTEAAKRKPASKKKSGLSRSFLLSSARMPLTIVAHIFPGRRVVVRPTLAAIGSISGARADGANA